MTKYVGRLNIDVGELITDVGRLTKYVGRLNIDVGELIKYVGKLKTGHFVAKKVMNFISFD